MPKPPPFGAVDALDGMPSGNTAAPWNPVGWKDWYTEIVRQHVGGIPYGQIVRFFRRYGRKLGARHARRIVESPKGLEMAQLMRAQRDGTESFVDQVAAYTPEAIMTQVDALRNPYEHTRNRLIAAQDILDRGRVPKLSRQDTRQQIPTTIILNLTPSQLSSFIALPAAIEAVEVPLLPPIDSRDADAEV